MLKKLESDIIGLSLTTVVVWLAIFVLHLCGKNPLELTILIAAAIILPILLFVNLYSYKIHLDEENRRKNESKNESKNY